MYTKPDPNAESYIADLERRISELEVMYRKTHWWQWVKREYIEDERQLLQSFWDNAVSFRDTLGWEMRHW